MIIVLPSCFKNESKSYEVIVPFCPHLSFGFLDNSLHHLGGVYHSKFNKFLQYCCFICTDLFYHCLFSQRNYQFDFLRPQHSLFNYFTKLVEQYTKVRPKIMIIARASSCEREQHYYCNASRGYCTMNLEIACLSSLDYKCCALRIGF